MSQSSEDIIDEPPSSINPYEVLGVEKDATESEIKSAYRKRALKNHPDKVSTEEKENAHKTFQEIAFAYAILSDERRRKRYDVTGRTEESLDLEDDDFNWADFYREQWRDSITEEVIEKFKLEYKGSDEEKCDLLKFYEMFEGNMSKIYQMVMLSDPLEDEERFRGIIDAAIVAGEVESYSAYTKESKASRKRRLKEARKEATKEEQEALEMARELGLEDKLFNNEPGNKKPSKKSKKPTDESTLASLIMARQKDRSTSFLDRLEAKYSAPATAKAGRKSKKRGSADMDDRDGGGDGARPAEPPEEAFRRMAEKGSRAKAERGGGGKRRKGLVDEGLDGDEDRDGGEDAGVGKGGRKGTSRGRAKGVAGKSR
ncbi:hypothetical protein FGG08_001304 [Glutinoglossum americanum]|uniref:J domain-containing protein n=1 Tax=Glutinoglossum americanum TaxID=1670608 RepID=A0A9P8I8G6_9PEZI|nr:hypothetical protein FGG08_001304 [Glutinoglossum americanum]